MSAEDVQELIDDALGVAVANDTDLDEVERILTDAVDRVDQLRIARGEA
ncbi:hypothetical protein Hbl1158_10325 [Halobaculum sp. CBA1158]|nr:hypothetical protein [Halobaculum sp. CBA1158]UIO98930.1 hypothetical protein Hbl1158_10325 [Halobaculum sp. CBA1158]